MTAVSIRPARPADAATIAAVLGRAFAPYEGRLDPPAGASRETAQTIGAKLVAERALVAEIDRSIVGCVFFRPAAEPATFYLGRLAVMPEQQGRGLAARLMAELERVARAEGMVALVLNVRLALPANRALFERLGFHLIGDGCHPGYQQPTFAIMRKELGR